MEQKTISINPSLFNISNKKNKKKPIPLKLSKPTNLKKELIRKIKSYQNKTRKRKTYPLDDKFQSEFKESLDYLKNVLNEKKQTSQEALSRSDDELKGGQSFIAASTPSGQTQSQQLSQPQPQQTPQMSSVAADVPYGNLKNGMKPTWRKWVRSQSLKKPREINDSNTTNEKTEQYAHKTQLESHNMEISDNFSISGGNNQYSNSSPSIPTTTTIRNETAVKSTTKKKKPRRLRKKTIKKKYTCGKSKTKKLISVVIKDIQTKNKVLQEKRELKQAPMSEIKNFLFKHSFIKVGSTAPDKILRDMYESIILAGEVHNTNKENMIHNFLNDAV